MQAAADPNLSFRKLVNALRQIARNMNMQVEARMEDASPEAKGFLSEAVDQYADRISSYATELAQAIGYVEPTADVTAARCMAIDILARIGGGLVVVRRDPRTVMEVVEAQNAVACGDLDDCELMTDITTAIQAGRRLAEEDARRERITEMLRPAAKLSRVTPDRLTITIEGPQGSGKTRMACFIIEKAAGYLGLAPRVIEIDNDGRRFDVRNEEYLDHG